MRDIYLIDFENVASEGLSGITYLSPEDEVIIFYSNNSNRLSMKMHILIGKSVCKLDYFEVAVGGKNALDHQISTWLGYLVGTHAAERNYYIVSRDMGYKFVASFWAESELKPNVRCIENIRVAGRIERSRAAREARAAETSDTPATPAALEPPLQLAAAPVQAALRAAPQEAAAAEAPQEKPQPVQPEAAVPQEEPQPVQPETVPQEETMPEPQETVPQEEPQPVQPEAASQEEPQPVQPEAALQEESQMEPSPAQEGHARSYKGRQRYRRNRTRTGNHEAESPAAPEQKAAAPEKKPEPQKAPIPEPKPEVQKAPVPEPKPEVQKAPVPEPKPEVQKAPVPEPKPEAQRAEQKPVQRTGKPAQKYGNSRKKEPEAHRPVDLSQLISPYPELQEHQLQQLIADNKRQVLCNTLRKQLGQEKGLALYNEIKKSAWR